ncbi:YIP1 family protein [Candidatus Pacearchaeota archaeon]|nr:YIP1 family protein [Candidatus Pacearchaeota archaeon]
MPSLRDFVKKALEHGFTKHEIVSELLKKGYSKEELIDAFKTRRQIQNSNKYAQTKLLIIDKIKLIFSNPTSFFHSVNEPTISNSLIMYIIIAAILSAINIALSFVLNYGVLRQFVGFGLSFLFYPVFFGIGIAITFAFAGISHLAIKLMKGNGSYVNTYNVLVYSLIPFLIISIIPIIGFLSIIYSIVLMTIGFSIQHNISKGKSVIAALTPLIILFVLVILLIIYLIFALRNVF